MDRRSHSIPDAGSVSSHRNVSGPRNQSSGARCILHPTSRKTCILQTKSNSSVSHGLTQMVGPQTASQCVVNPPVGVWLHPTTVHQDSVR